jgi:uncharacterized protein
MVRWADPERIAEAVREYAAAMRREKPQVRRIYWYGSWVSGDPIPSSDADICVVVSEDERRPRDRLPEFLPARFPVGIDLSVVTEEELESLRERAPEWYRAITSGRLL